MAEVEIRDHDTTISVEGDQTLLSAILDAGIPIVHECGGNGRCGTCSVIVLEGADELPEPNFPEQEVLRLRRKAPCARLSCRLRPKTRLTVQIHRESDHTTKG